MRIAHVTATFPPSYSGTGVVCYYNALGLARLGHPVTVFTAADASTQAADPTEFTVRRLPALFRLGNAPFLPGLLRLSGFDLVHLHYPFYFGAEMVWLGALSSGLRYVVTYHQDVLFPGLLRWPERLHHRMVGKRILDRASRILATSLDYARASRLQPWLGQGPQKVQELPNGVDAERFRPGLDSSAWRARYGLRTAERVVLFVGALDRAHYFKGVPVLLQALASLKGENTRLLLVGEGDLRASYEQQAHLLGLSDRVRFCGRVSDRDLPAHYALCDLLVLPSTTLGEAFGVVLLEAMACGKPVVASNLPGVRSVVSDGQDGLLVRPRDVPDLATKMQMLLDDAPRCQEMGKLGRAKVEARYNWPVIIPRLLQVYEEVLGSEGAGAKGSGGGGGAREERGREAEGRRSGRAGVKAIQSREELDVYRLASEAAMRIFEVSKSVPREEVYSLTDQIRRSSRSVCANLAEAWRKRRYEAAFVLKLNDSEAEAAETQTWIRFAIDCGYLKPDAGQELFQAYDYIIGKLVNMIIHPSPWILDRNKH